MSPLKSGFGEQIEFGSLGSGQGAVPSSAIGGLSSRQVVFGSPSGGVAQDPALIWDSTAKELVLSGNPRYVVASDSAVTRLFQYTNAARSVEWWSLQGTTQGKSTVAVLDGGGDFNVVNSVGAQFLNLSTVRAFIGVAAGGAFVNSSGHVGIGTTAPVQLLHVNGAGGNAFVRAETKSAGAQAGLQIFSGTTAGNNGAARIDFYNANASTSQPRWGLFNDFDQNGGNIFSIVDANNLQRLNVTSSGQVGINTTNPSAALEVAGNSRLANSTAFTFSAFGVAGSTQASSYTTGSASTGRTLPSTITTVAGLMSAAERENFNRVAQVLETLIKGDLAGYGWTR